MKREIKFRAWDKESKMFSVQKILFGSVGEGVFCVEGINFDKDYKITTKRMNICEEDCGQNTPHCELMQFTGLKDKNGKEIYEGDIVKCNKNVAETFGIEEISEVKYIMGSFYAGTTLFHLVDIDGIYRGEVIGNIYENQNLINNYS